MISRRTRWGLGLPLILLLMTLPAAAPAGTRTVTEVLRINEELINRYLQDQFNSSTGGGLANLREVSGSVYVAELGVSCSFTIKLGVPRVRLTPGTVKVDMVFGVTSSCGSYAVAIRPTLRIPTGAIDLSTLERLTGYMDEFPGLVDQQPIPTWVKTELKNRYRTVYESNAVQNLVVYPSKIKHAANGHWFESRALDVQDFGMSLGIGQGAIEVSAHVDVLSEKTDWIAGYFVESSGYLMCDVGQMYVGVNPNFKLQLAKVKIWAENGALVHQKVFPAGTVAPEGMVSRFCLDQDRPTQAQYFIEIWGKNDQTWFLRRFPSGSGYFLPTSSRNPENQ